MDNVPTIPALPELPTTGIARTAVNGTPYMLKAVTVENDTIRVFDTAQMTAYGQQCYAAGVQDGKELAVRVALAMAADRRRDLQGLSLVPPAALTVQH
jgi:hypothetical protein